MEDIAPVTVINKEHSFSSLVFCFVFFCLLGYVERRFLFHLLLPSNHTLRCGGAIHTRHTLYRSGSAFVFCFVFFVFFFFGGGGVGCGTDLASVVVSQLLAAALEQLLQAEFRTPALGQRRPVAVDQSRQRREDELVRRHVRLRLHHRHQLLHEAHVHERICGIAPLPIRFFFNDFQTTGTGTGTGRGKRFRQ